ncbi:MAG: cytochrome c peroxidase [Paraglaciecola sp.]|jgi:cytochrome c peroxidase
MRKFLFCLFVIPLFWTACKDDDVNNLPVEESEEDLLAIEYNPISVTLELHDSLPQMNIPADNPLTEAGIELGRYLFYDPILSADSTMSCNSCHLLDGGLTDNMAVSVGVNGSSGQRSSMSLFNIGFANNGLFWDGRVMTLEEQALLPIEDIHEFAENWDNVEVKLRRSTFYPAMFREAFGIEKRSKITRDLAVKAIASFERTLILFGGSVFDRVNYLQEPGLELPDLAIDGFEMFRDNVFDNLPDIECEHCHTRPLFTSDNYRNNGLDEAENLEDFDDLGRGGFTMNPIDNGKFRSPTLRNIALTAPYMHDGRFQTLREVVEHYNSGGHPSLNKNTLIVPLGMEDPDVTNQIVGGDAIDAVVAFLHTLTDTTYLSNPAFQNPFEN